MKLPPAPVALALSGSAILGLIGLASLTGLDRAFAGVSLNPSSWAPLLLFGVLALVVLAGEIAAASLINRSRDRRDDDEHLWANVALGGYFALAVSCALLAHEGLLTLGRPYSERALIEARQAVAEAQASRDVAAGALRDASAAYDASVADLRRQIEGAPADTWTQIRERDKLRSDLRALINGRDAAIEDERQADADAARALAAAQTAERSTSRGFLSLAINIGGFSLALIPALLAAALVFLKDWYGRIARTPRRGAGPLGLNVEQIDFKAFDDSALELVKKAGFAIGKRAADEASRRTQLLAKRKPL